MSGELAIIPRAVEALNLTDAVEAILGMVDEQEIGKIDEVRRRAEAHALYEKRRDNLEGERGYSTLRLLSEAAIGVLAFDDPQLLRQANLTYKAAWMALAAALERGVILTIIEQVKETLTTTRVAERVRDEGYTSVPGQALGMDVESVMWSMARNIARDQGKSLTDLPADKGAITRRRRADKEASQRMRQMYRDQARAERRRQRDNIKSAAESRGERTKEAYSLLRKTLLALHEAQREFPRRERRDHIDLAFHHLYEAEREIGNALGFAFPGADDPRYASVGSDEG